MLGFYFYIIIDDNKRIMGMNVEFNELAMNGM